MSEKQVPYWSVIWSGGLAGILALLLNLDSLWDFVSIVSRFLFSHLIGWQRWTIPPHYYSLHPEQSLSMHLPLGTLCGYGAVCLKPLSLNPQGTLCAYGAVCVACLWRRYNVVGQTPVVHGRIMAGLLVGIIACGLWAGFGNQASKET